jgi:hypothetical protein
MQKDETPTMKRQVKCKSLIDQWSRSISKKSGNMRDLGRVDRFCTGLSQINRAHLMEEQVRERAARAPVIRGHRGGKDQDIDSLGQE